MLKRVNYQPSSDIKNPHAKAQIISIPSQNFTRILPKQNIQSKNIDTRRF